MWCSFLYGVTVQQEAVVVISFFSPPPHFVSLIILALLNKTNDNVIN